MIEISHAQARFLIRESLDARAGDGRRLPEEQWAALQAHLEHCPVCRDYQQRVTGLERDLRRALNLRWRYVPAPEMVTALAAGRKARRHQVARARRAGAAALAVLVLVALLWWNHSTRSAGDQLAAVQTPTVTPTPTPPAYFDGVVAYSARGENGDQEIFLLQSQGGRVEVANLTGAPGDDTAPAWSPDGEWIAFLSDRGGRRELFVMNVAGSRVVQLTHAPDIEWQGPLTWSPDGRWIALPARRRNAGGLSWLFLAPVDGSIAGRPLPVPGSRGVDGRARFIDAPGEAMDLFFQRLPSPDLTDPGAITRVRILAGERETLTPTTSYDDQMIFSGGFDAGGLTSATNILYLVHTMDQASVRSLAINEYSGTLRAEMDRGAFGTLQDVTLIPWFPMAAYLSDAQHSGCWRLTFRMLDRISEPWRINNLCVDGGLAPGQWATNNGWGVVYGRVSGQAGPPRLFAVAIEPVQEGETVASIIYPLGEADGLEGALQVRPAGAFLSINPSGPQPLAAGSPTRPGPRGSLVVTAQEGENARVEQVALDGTGVALLQEADARNACPALSPDGAYLAYRSNLDSPVSTLSRLYLREIGETDTAPRLLDLPDVNYTDFDCPVWSPDGTALAVVVRAFGLSYLAVFPLAGEVVDSADAPAPRYLLIDEPSVHIRPVWMPDGRSLYLTLPKRMVFPPAVTRFLWDGSELISNGIILSLQGWDEIPGLSISPDGRQMAMHIARYQNASNGVTSELRVYDRMTWRLLARQELHETFAYGIQRPGQIFWEPGGQLIFSLSGSLLLNPASFIRFDPSSGALQALAISPDVVSDWTVKDGWLLYASESGLWGLLLEPSEAPRRDPLHLLPGLFSEID